MSTTRTATFAEPLPTTDAPVQSACADWCCSKGCIGHGHGRECARACTCGGRAVRAMARRLTFALWAVAVLVLGVSVVGVAAGLAVRAARHDERAALSAAASAQLDARSARARARLAEVDRDEMQAAAAAAEQRAADAPSPGSCAALRFGSSQGGTYVAAVPERLYVACGDRARDAVAHALDEGVQPEAFPGWLASRYPLVVLVVNGTFPASR